MDSSISMALGFLHAIPIQIILEQLKEKLEKYSINPSKENLENLEVEVMSASLKLNMEKKGLKQMMQDLEKGDFASSIINKMDQGEN